MRRSSGLTLDSAGSICDERSSIRIVALVAWLEVCFDSPYLVVDSCARRDG